MSAPQSVVTKNTESQTEWQKPSLQNYDRILENLITKNASLERRQNEMELDFSILCIALSVASVIGMFLVYLF